MRISDWSSDVCSSDLLHEENGVLFHLARTAFEFDGRTLTPDNGDTLEADLIVVGIGVRPRTSLAKSANISVEDGLLVNEYLETSVPGIYAAGDIARYPDARSGRPVRVEHWVTALEQE